MKLRLIINTIFIIGCALAFPQQPDDPCFRKCTREIIPPFCGSNGKTYNNECVFEVDKCRKLGPELRITSQGRCLDKVESKNNENESVFDTECSKIECSRELAHVCGSNGKTYNNFCLLKKQECLNRNKIEKKHDGKCTICEEECPKVKEPICASDGQTYESECKMHKRNCNSNTARIRKVSDGECERQGEDCGNFCPLLFKPVCGTDGNTYGNACQLKNKACRERSELVVDYPGNCRTTTTTESPCATVCPADFDPVCGSDGITYSNECNLNAANCQQGTDVKVQSQGKCEAIKFPDLSDTNAESDDCIQHCPQLLRPICGSNGQTFGNLCEMKVAMCKDKNKTLTMLHEGSCDDHTTVVDDDGDNLPIIEALEAENDDASNEDCPTFCTQEWRPVCGTDGKTYGNKCIFKTEVCKNNPRLELASIGECIIDQNKPQIEAVEVEENEEERCPTFCTQEWSPVCGSDGQTYGNKCMLSTKSCKNPALQLQMVSTGECSESGKPLSIEAVEAEQEEKCPILCTQEWRPVCGTDGMTYGNECTLKAKACKNPNFRLEVASNGECLSKSFQLNEEENSS